MKSSGRFQVLRTRSPSAEKLDRELYEAALDRGLVGGVCRSRSSSEVVGVVSTFSVLRPPLPIPLLVLPAEKAAPLQTTGVGVRKDPASGRPEGIGGALRRIFARVRVQNSEQPINLVAKEVSAVIKLLTKAAWFERDIPRVPRSTCQDQRSGGAVDKLLLNIIRSGREVLCAVCVPCVSRLPPVSLNSL